MEEEKNIEKQPENFEEKLKECEKQKNEYLDGWKRERASFLNYKKEEMERIDGLMKYCNEEMVLRILPILDNLYLAEKEIPDDFTNHEWVKGLLQIKNQALEFFKAHKVSEIEAKAGDNFDPNIHEAIGTVEEGDMEPGKIIEIAKRGYKLDDKVIRPAIVKVSK